MEAERSVCFPGGFPQTPGVWGPAPPRKRPQQLVIVHVQYDRGNPNTFSEI